MHVPRRLLLPALLLAALAPAGAEEVVSYTVVDGLRIEEPLAGLSGDPVRGAALFGDPARGGCASCHTVGGSPIDPRPPLAVTLALAPDPPPAKDAPATVRDYPADFENATPAPETAPPPTPRPAPEAEAETWTPPRIVPHRGPALDSVGSRLGPGELRLIVVNPRLRDPFSTMPAFYDVSLDLASRNPSLRQPWLTAQQVEDLVAWLATLEEADVPESAASDTGN
jgi:hypothetical protein